MKSLNIPTRKRCSRCGKTKLLSLFHKSEFHYLKAQSWCKECVANYALINPDKNKLATIKYRIRYPERCRLAKRKWAFAHPENGCAKTMRYYARKLKATIGDSIAIEKIYRRAAELRKWFNVVVDHKIPLSKGGAHSPKNLQIIYAYENARKGARLDYQPSVVFI